MTFFFSKKKGDKILISETDNKNILAQPFNIKLFEHNEKYELTVNISYNDYCKNGHNSFHITGYFRNYEDYTSQSGSIHDTISEIIPELKKYLKWHGFTQDGPIHYVENITYYAEEEKSGVPDSWSEFLRFKGFPISFKYPDYLRDFIRKVDDFSELEILEIGYNGKNNGSYKFGPKYTFKGMPEDWYKCEFDTEYEIREFKKACVEFGVEFIRNPVGWTEGKVPDIEAARKCAIWPDATLEQLRNKDLLEERRGDLINEFTSDIIELKQKYKEFLIE